MNNAPLDELQEYARSLVDAVPSATTTRAVNSALAGRTNAVPMLRRRLATVGVVVMTFVSGNAGMAFASDSATPGDLLYGIDRAYESLAATVGVGGDHAEERLEEASELIRRGEVALALSTAREGIENVSGDLEASSVAVALDGIDMAMDNNGSAAEAAEIVAIAHLVVLAAHSGDHTALLAAAHEIRTIALEFAKSRQSPDSPSGTAPGQTGDNPSDTAPGQTGDNPSDTAPGQTGDNPSDTAPGQTGDNPSDTAPGQTGDNPSDTAPGQTGDNPSDTAPGQTGDNPNVTAPGQSSDADAPAESGKPEDGGKPEQSPNSQAPGQNADS